MEKLYSDSYLRDLDRPALQALCKKHGLKAMGKRDALIKLLSRQVIPGHESIKKDMTRRKGATSSVTEKKSVNASRRSQRNAAQKNLSSPSAETASENMPIVDMKDVLLAVEQNGEQPPASPIVLRSTDASEPRVEQEAAAVGPQRSQRASNRVNPLARPRPKASRRSAASGLPALPIQDDVPETSQELSAPNVEQEQVGSVAETPVEIIQVENEPVPDLTSQDSSEDGPVPTSEPTDGPESEPVVLRNFPELEFPTIVGFYARRQLRLQHALARASDPTRAQTPEPEELPGPGTMTPPGPASPTNPPQDEPDWQDFRALMDGVVVADDQDVVVADGSQVVVANDGQIVVANDSQVVVPKKKKDEVPLPQPIPPIYTSSGRRCRARPPPSSPRAREPNQLVAALENSRKMRRMYRLLWHRVMRSHEAVFKASRPNRTFVWPAIPKELRPYPGEDPDPEDDSELFSQVYADSIKLDQLSPTLCMEAYKLLFGKVDPSELAKISDVPEVVDEPVVVPEVKPQVPVETPAEVAGADAAAGPAAEDQDAEGEPENDDDMVEVDCTPVVDAAELKRQQKRRRAQIAAFQHMPEWQLPKFKRFVRHWTHAGARQPDAPRRHGAPYMNADVPLDLDAIAAPRRPPYFMAYNIMCRSMSEADAFSLFLDAENGGSGDALDFYDDDEDMEDEDDDFDEDCDEDVGDAMVGEPTQAFEPQPGQFAQTVDPSVQTAFDGSASQQAFEFPAGQQTAPYAASATTIDPNSLFVFEQFSAQDGMVQHTQTVDGAMLQQQQQQAVFNFDQVIFGDAASQGQQQEQQQYGMENGFPAQAPTPQDLLAQQQQQQQEQQMFLTEQQQQELNALAASANWGDFGSNGWNFDGPQMPMTPAPGATASFDDGGSFASSPAMTFDSNSSFDASSPFECHTPFDAASFAGDTPMDVDSIITPEALQNFASQWEENGMGGIDQYSQCGIQSPQPVHHQQIQLQPEPQQLVLPGDVQQYESPMYDDPWPPARPAGTAHQYDAASLAQWRPYAARYLKHARGRLPGFLLGPPENTGPRYFIEPPHRPAERSLGGWIRDIQFLMRREAPLPADDTQEKWATPAPERRRAPVGLSRFNPAAATAPQQQN